MNLRLRVDPLAVARIKHPIPTPTICRYCNAPVELVKNSAIYGRCVGLWPYAYKCTACDAYVGLHPNTDIALGTLADARLRGFRQDFKDVFNLLWVKGSGRWPRSQAYSWLAVLLDIPAKDCHGACFDEERCIAATNFCKVQLSRWGIQMPVKTKKAEHELQARSERVPDWYDERNQYLNPHDTRAAQRDTGKTDQSPPR